MQNIIITPSFVRKHPAPQGALRRGVAVSTYFIALDLGLGVGPYALGAFKDGIGFEGIYAACGAAALLCAGLYYLLYARKRDAAPVVEMKLETEAE